MNVVAVFLELKCTKCMDTNSHKILIGTGYVLIRYSFQDIQYNNVFKTKVTVNSNSQCVLNRNPN